MSDEEEDAISDISDGDIELSDEDMKALGIEDEDPPAAEDEPPVAEEPSEEEPPPQKKKPSKLRADSGSESMSAESPRGPKPKPSKAAAAPPPSPPSKPAKAKAAPEPEPKPLIARKRKPVSTGEEPTSWDMVEDDEEDYENAEFEQPVLVGADPFESDANDVDYYERLEDPLGIKAATSLFLEAIRTANGKSKKKKKKGAKKKKGKSKLIVLDYSQQNFSARAYLSTVHKKTPIDKLISGKALLEKKVTSRQKQLEFLVKENFPRFVICKDAIDDVYTRVETERRAEGAGNPLDACEISYVDLISSSKGLFDKLLDRQQEIDKIRNVLSILKRSQFIFNLPRRMRESIEKGEYSKVVLNYKKVKSIVASAVHASIKNIVLEVEKIVKDLHEQLFRSLDKPGMSLREQEEIIKLLIELGAPQDPAWHCIVKRYERIKEQLSRKGGLTASNAGNASGASGSSSGQSSNTLQIRQTPSARALMMATAASPHNQAAAVLTFSNILVDQLPQLWQMSRSFFSGEYHKGVSEKRRKELTDQYSEEQFAKLFKELMQLYVDVVGKNFSPEFLDMKNKLHEKMMAPRSPEPTSPSGSKKRSRAASVSTKAKRSASVVGAEAQAQALAAAATVSYMFSSMDEDEEDTDKEKVAAVLKCWRTISSLGVPPSYYSPITDTLDQLTRVFTIQTVEMVMTDMRTIYTFEDWQIEEVIYGVTCLPLTFEATMRALLVELEGIIQPDDPLVVFVQKSFAECINIFADNMYHLAMVNPSGLVGAMPTVQNMNIDLSPYYDDGRSVVGVDGRLLLTINNCRYTRMKIVPDLIQRYQREFNRPLFKFSSAGTHLFEEIEKMCLQRYVANKTVILNALVKNGMLFTGFDWQTQSPPLGVRDFINTALMTLIFIHDEMYRLSKQVVDYVLVTLVEQIMMEFSNCFDYVDSISQYAALQVGMELSFFWMIVSVKYSSDLSSTLYKEIDSILGYSAIMESPDTNQKDKNNIKTLLKMRQAHSELLFECFSVPHPNSPFGNHSPTLAAPKSP